MFGCDAADYAVRKRLGQYEQCPQPDIVRGVLLSRADAVHGRVLRSVRDSCLPCAYGLGH
jgi:hypothetical protein